MVTGVRDLRSNLSRYLRRVQAGERIAVTVCGRAVAELVPAPSVNHRMPGGQWDALVAAGRLRPPVEKGDPFEDWPNVKLPRGTAAELIDSDRGDG